VLREIFSPNAVTGSTGTWPAQLKVARLQYSGTRRFDNNRITPKQPLGVTSGGKRLNAVNNHRVKSFV